MPDMRRKEVVYDRPVEVSQGVHWVGFYDARSGLHCNPYLIIDNDEAVVIDGGSRPDFPAVMMKILQTGIAPSSITALIYHHFDPDLCGSLPHFEALIGTKDLKVISDRANHMFIRHYSVSSNLLSLEDVEHRFRFRSGRVLQFENTPFAHSEGSSVTFDPVSGILFSSDLFGSYALEWDLFLRIEPECKTCTSYKNCPNGKIYCPIPDILRFHQKIMPSCKALRHALERMSKIPFQMIAPQHGSIIKGADSIMAIVSRLSTLEEVGIDGIAEKGCEFGTCNISDFKERLSSHEEE